MPLSRTLIAFFRGTNRDFLIYLKEMKKLLAAGPIHSAMLQ